MFKKLLNKICNNPSKKMSFKETYDLTGMPIVTFYQGEKKFNFILDTGSIENVIDKNAIDSLEHTPVEQDAYLMGLDGIEHKVTVERIVFSYKGASYPFNYLVKDMGDMLQKACPGIVLHGMLGSKFFDEYKYILDCNEFVAYSKT